MTSLSSLPTGPITLDAETEITSMISPEPVARYVWCQEDVDMEDLRCLVCSPVVVKFSTLFPEGQSRSLITTAIEHLKRFEMHEDQDKLIREEFCCKGNAEDAIDGSPTRAQDIAELLWLFKRELQSWEHDRGTPSDYDQYYVKAVNLMNKTAKHFPISIDDIPAKNRVGPDKLPPGLNDSECEEHGERPGLEICNRLWNLLLLVKRYLLTGHDAHQLRFLKTEERGTNYAQCFPLWWKSKVDFHQIEHALDYAEAVDRDSEDQPLPEFNNDVECVVKVMNKKILEERQQELEDDGIDAPDLPDEEAAIPNPCYYEDLAEWRDHIRHTFKVEKYRAAVLKTIKLKTINADDTDNSTVAIWGGEATLDYDEVLLEFQNPNIKRAIIMVTFNMASKSDYECPASIPAGAKKFLRVGADGDVEHGPEVAKFLAQLGSEANSVPSSASEPAFEKELGGDSEDGDSTLYDSEDDSAYDGEDDIEGDAFVSHYPAQTPEDAKEKAV